MPTTKTCDCVTCKALNSAELNRKFWLIILSNTWPESFYK